MYNGLCLFWRIADTGVINGLQFLNEHRLGILYVAEGDRTLAEEAVSHLSVNQTVYQIPDPGNNHLITGLTGKKGFIALTFVKSRECDKLESIRSVLDVFARYKVPVEHIPTSIDSFSVISEKSKLEDRYFDLVAELKKLPEIVSISEDADVALIAIVGSNMAKKSGVSGRLLSVFGEEKINIKLIDQGREEINIIVGISNADYDKSLKALYTRFSGEII